MLILVEYVLSNNSEIKPLAYQNYNSCETRRYTVTMGNFLCSITYVYYSTNSAASFIRLDFSISVAFAHRFEMV